jgi:hypothetical protein
MLAIEREPLAALQRPYPGLRAFEPYESFLFFGRETHTEELLRRLAANRFLAVVGASGGGKSSLVRAGLLPALYRGYLVGSTSRWRIAIMRPGGAPIEALATALNDPEALGQGDIVARQGTLRATSLGLADAVRRAQLEAGESLLLVVDQFEEIFRFAGERRAEDYGAEAALFVSLLLHAAEQPEVSIYVVLTMRSDFLGDCAQFSGLPEALNQAQYLIPRLTREQRRQAIEMPLSLAGIGVKPGLVQQILNEAGEDPDQLPVLQHALLRTFGCWQQAGSEGDVDLGHYEAAGGIARALNDHADEVQRSFADPDRALTAKIFRCLTTTESGRTVRRPARFGRLCEVVGATSLEDRNRVAAIVRRFADRANSLLMASSAELESSTVIDISHESLIRKWARLREWVVQEGKSADWYRDLARDVLRHRSGEAGLCRDPDLSRILQRSSEEGWNEAWAEQYWPAGDPSFEEIRGFLSLSERTQREEREREEARRQKELEDARRLARANKLAAILTLLLLLTGSIAVAVVHFDRRRNERTIEGITAKFLTTENALLKAEQQSAGLQGELDRTKRELLNANEQDRKELQAQLKQLETEYRNSKAEADRVRGQLKGLQNAPVVQSSDHAALLKRISELQYQLAQTTRERDDLRAQLDYTQESGVIVPRLIGLSPSVAVDVLRKVGLSYDIAGKGDVVYDQKPASGSRVKKGSTVSLVFAPAPSMKK